MSDIAVTDVDSGVAVGAKDAISESTQTMLPTHLSRILVTLGEVRHVPALMLADIRDVYAYLRNCSIVRFIQRFVAGCWTSLSEKFIDLYDAVVWLITALNKMCRACTSRNVMRLAHVFMVWEPLPLDFVLYVSKEERQKPFEERPGYAGVRMCWRLPDTQCEKNDIWELQFMKFSALAYFPLEQDGSLNVDQIRREWNVDEFELVMVINYQFMIPDRQDPFEPADPHRISSLGLYTLTYGIGHITVVALFSPSPPCTLERTTFFALTRRRLRQWLRKSSAYFTLQSACLFLPFSAAIVSLGTLLQEYSLEEFTKNVVAIAFCYACYTACIHRKYEDWLAYVHVHRGSLAHEDAKEMDFSSTRASSNSMYNYN
ncbi:hypothetical protein EW145_g4775 [Phellinidium pouzarii]|uniref:Uncharacterized protein n=1 Tax=Phellinidium pouzarii TaxID=167371 RepID=A0A4S4L297_9AGAM|nr:hypothetical protein EW145_g4775 [Phellinidium pouzarii]